MADGGEDVEVRSTSMTTTDGAVVKGGPGVGRFERLRGLETEQLPMPLSAKPLPGLAPASRVRSPTDDTYED